MVAKTLNGRIKGMVSLFPLVNLLQIQLHLSCARFMLRLLKVLLHFEFQEGKNGHQR